MLLSTQIDRTDFRLFICPKGCVKKQDGEAVSEPLPHPVLVVSVRLPQGLTRLRGLPAGVTHDLGKRHIFQVGDFYHVAGLGAVDELSVAEIDAHVGYRAVEADNVARAHLACGHGHAALRLTA